MESAKGPHAVENAPVTMATRPDPALVRLPWSTPLAEWSDEYVVPLPRGLSRHIVRIVRLGERTYAIKETQEDIAFPRELVAGQPSRRLARMHALLMGEIELCIGQVQANQLRTATDVSLQHQGILDAVIAGDADLAEQLTREHIYESRERLLEHVDGANR